MAGSNCRPLQCQYRGLNLLVGIFQLAIWNIKQHLDPLLELWSEMAPRREDPIDPFPDYDSEPVFSWN